MLHNAVGNRATASEKIDRKRCVSTHPTFKIVGLVETLCKKEEAYLAHVLLKNVFITWF